MKNKKSTSSIKKTTKKVSAARASAKKIVVKKTARSGVRKTGTMAAKKSVADVIKGAERKSELPLAKKIGSKAAAVKSSEKNEKKITKKNVLGNKTGNRKIVFAASARKKTEKVSPLGIKKEVMILKKNDLKISAEFAMAVIFVLAGTFAYIFWKGSSEIEDSPSSMYVESGKKINADVVVKSDKNWKTYRNESIGGEFSLPKNWKMLEEGNKFISENSPEEIVVIPEKNEKQYDVESLLEIAKEENEDSNVSILPTNNGIKLEKRDGDIIRQTAKILTSGYILTATYSTYGSENDDLFFDEIVPTFKAM